MKIMQRIYPPNLCLKQLNPILTSDDGGILHFLIHLPQNHLNFKTVKPPFSMKKIIVLALCIITLGTLNSCKKYEDGPAFSLRSKKSRVAAEWNVKKYTYGGVDVLTEKNDDVMFCNTGDPVNYSESITYTYTFDLTKEGDITLTVVV